MSNVPEEPFELSDEVKPYFSDEPLPASVVEDRYEAIEMVLRAPAEGESWFDRIFDFIALDCEGGDEGGCTCGMEHMGGMTGTYDQAIAHSTNLGQGLQPIDVARVVVFLTDTERAPYVIPADRAKVIDWAHGEVKFEDWFTNKEWENDEDDENEEDEE